MERGGAVYIMTTRKNTAIYVGVTSDLYSRVIDHRNKVFPNSHTAKYNIQKLVYFETFHSIEEAIAREKQIKAGSRKKKNDLVNSMNPEWNDLFDEISKW